VEELKAQGPQEIAIAVAGNKADLEDQRVWLCSKNTSTQPHLIILIDLL
jgi:hypothetical protein